MTEGGEERCGECGYRVAVIWLAFGFAQDDGGGRKSVAVNVVIVSLLFGWSFGFAQDDGKGKEDALGLSEWWGFVPWLIIREFSGDLLNFMRGAFCLGAFLRRHVLPKTGVDFFCN
jgi:hypothetical protein